MYLNGLSLDAFVMPRMKTEVLAGRFLSLVLVHEDKRAGVVAVETTAYLFIPWSARMTVCHYTQSSTDKYIGAMSKRLFSCTRNYRLL